MTERKQAPEATREPPSVPAVGSQVDLVLGPLPERAVVAYLYHDAATPEDAHPWLHSTRLVLAADRRPTLRNETPLVALAQAQAMVAAERERWQPAAEKARAALSELLMTRDPLVYSDALRALDEVLGPNASFQVGPTARAEAGN